MNRATTLAAAALLAVSSPVLAAGLGVNAHANIHASANVGGGNAAVNAAGNANAAASTPSYGTIVSAVASGKNQSLPTNVADVQIVTLSSLKGHAASHAKALAQLTKKRATSIGKLDTAVAADATVMAKLTAAGYTADQVIAVSSGTNGSVTVYVNA